MIKTFVINFGGSNISESKEIFIQATNKGEAIENFYIEYGYLTLHHVQEINCSPEEYARLLAS